MGDLHQNGLESAIKTRLMSVAPEPLPTISAKVLAGRITTELSEGSVMEFNLDHATDLLNRTPKVLRVMLQGLPSEWVANNEGEKTWSPYDVLGHLIHGERTDWIPRAKTILGEGEGKTFEPFDRYAQFEESMGKSMEELLATFEGLRRENIRTLNEMELKPEDLRRTGRHPELGRVTLGELLATWVAHDQDHLVQISRTIARQYQEAVGPWRAYLSVMK